jgi:hypothetical protein
MIHLDQSCYAICLLELFSIIDPYGHPIDPSTDHPTLLGAVRGFVNMPGLTQCNLVIALCNGNVSVIITVEELMYNHETPASIYAFFAEKRLLMFGSHLAIGVGVTNGEGTVWPIMELKDKFRAFIDQDDIVPAT